MCRQQLRAGTSFRMRLEPLIHRTMRLRLLHVMRDTLPARCLKELTTPEPSPSHIPQSIMSKLASSHWSVQPNENRMLVSARSRNIPQCP